MKGRFGDDFAMRNDAPMEGDHPQPPGSPITLDDYVRDEKGDPILPKEGKPDPLPPEAFVRDQDGHPLAPEEDRKRWETEVEATPAAAEAADEADVDLTEVKGTGAKGRVTKSDVEKAKQ